MTIGQLIDAVWKLQPEHRRVRLLGVTIHRDIYCVEFEATDSGVTKTWSYAVTFIDLEYNPGIEFMAHNLWNSSEIQFKR